MSVERGVNNGTPILPHSVLSSRPSSARRPLSLSLFFFFSLSLRSPHSVLRSRSPLDSVHAEACGRRDRSVARDWASDGAQARGRLRDRRRRALARRARVAGRRDRARGRNCRPLVLDITDPDAVAAALSRRRRAGAGQQRRHRRTSSRSWSSRATSGRRWSTSTSTRCSTSRARCCRRMIARKSRPRRRHRLDLRAQRVRGRQLLRRDEACGHGRSPSA